MKTSTTINTILKTDKNALRALAGVFGFDFEADFIAAELDVPFTVNKINKFLAGAGVDVWESCTVALVQSPVRWRADALYVAKINYSDFDINFRIIDSGLYNVRGLDEYSRRGDFNEDRKQEGGRVYIISQNKKLLKMPYKCREPFDINSETRYILKDASELWAWDPVQKRSYKKRGVSTLELTLPNARRARKVNAAADNISEVFDKSGYFIKPKRDTLKRRAAALRAERQKAEADAADHSAALAEISAKIEDLKKAAADAILTAKNKNFNKITNILWRYDGLEGVVKNYVDFETACNEKKFSSIENYTRDYNEIKNRINSVNAKIKEALV